MKVGELNSISPYINFSCVWEDNPRALRAKWIGDLAQNDIVIILGQSISDGRADRPNTLTLSKHGIGWIDGRDLRDVK